MAEPTTTAAGSATVSVVSLAVAFAGPLLGPYAVIFLSSLAGALWPLLLGETESKRAGFSLLARVVTMALVLTGFVSLGIERFFDIPAHESLGPVAFVIAMLGNGWRVVFAAVQSALIGAISKAGGGRNGQ